VETPRSKDFELSQRSDNELVQAAVAGDRAAYGTLYDRYAPLVRAVCYDHTRNLADAQDLAQDVFLRATSGWTGSATRPPLALAVATARHRCLNGDGRRS
jgi:DNA-directed RNA polymerase specialized sigma24 family protein